MPPICLRGESCPMTQEALGELNRIVGVLVGHIRTEDKRLARHIAQLSK